MSCFAAAEILKCYALREPVSVSPLHKDNVFSVRTGDGEYILKKEPAAARGPAKIEEEHRLLRYLSRSGVPVACPVETADGASFILREDELYVLMPRLAHTPGDFFSPGSGVLYRNIGKAVAGLHAALALYPCEIRSFVIEPYANLYNRILPDLYAPGTACAAEAEILSDLRAEMESALGNLPRQRIHGDCHDGNVCLENGRVSGFIDTDHLPLGPRLFDICEYLIHIIKWDAGDPVKTETFLRLFPEFIRGYLEAVPLTDGERHAVWHMLLYMQAAFYHYKIQNGWPDAPKDLEAFRWVYRNRSKIEESLRESGMIETKTPGTVL